MTLTSVDDSPVEIVRGADAFFVLRGTGLQSENLTFHASIRQDGPVLEGVTVKVVSSVNNSDTRLDMVASADDADDDYLGTDLWVVGRIQQPRAVSSVGTLVIKI